jgi:hypothetical protein
MYFIYPRFYTCHGCEFLRNAGKGFLWEGGFLVILGGFMGEKEGLGEDAVDLLRSRQRLLKEKT